MKNIVLGITGSNRKPAGGKAIIFLANIGNTNLTYGLFQQEIIASGHFPIQKLSEQSDIESLYHSLLRKHGLSHNQIADSVVSSVVTEKTPMLLNAVKRVTSSEPFFVSSQMDWEFDISSYSGILGSDRLLCCSAALKKYRPPFIVVDFGTATTVNVVDQSGAFIGGVILPGVSTGLQALSVKTSLLHTISFFHPESVIGKNTAECMLSGATYGTAGMIDGLVKRIKQELGGIASVIVTGGNVEAVAPYCDLELHVEPNLLLEGLAIRFLGHEAVYSNKRRTL